MKGGIKKNLQLKILALIIAIILWIYVKYNLGM